MCLIGRLWTESESHVSNKLVWVSVFGDERKNPYDLLLDKGHFTLYYTYLHMKGIPAVFVEFTCTESMKKQVVISN